jgi:hypothetical protein
MTAPVEIAPAKRTHVFGIRFHPHGASAFTGIPQHELRDVMAPADSVLGAGVGRWREQIGNGIDPVSTTNRFLRGRRVTRLPDARLELPVNVPLRVCESGAGASLEHQEAGARVPGLHRPLTQNDSAAASLSTRATAAAGWKRLGGNCSCVQLLRPVASHRGLSTIRQELAAGSKACRRNWGRAWSGDRRMSHFPKTRLVIFTYRKAMTRTPARLLIAVAILAVTTVRMLVHGRWSDDH